jgi:hypothetical protein
MDYSKEANYSNNDDLSCLWKHFSRFGKLKTIFAEISPQSMMPTKWNIVVSQ